MHTQTYCKPNIAGGIYDLIYSMSEVCWFLHSLVHSMTERNVSFLQMGFNLHSKTLTGFDEILVSSILCTQTSSGALPTIGALGQAHVRKECGTEAR